MPDRPLPPDLRAGAPATPSQWLRTVGNALNLSTAFGLVVATIGGARLRLGPRGLILGERYRLAFPIAGAFTVGDVIITAGDFADLVQRHPRLLDHEERHSWQYFACLGLPFLVGYPAAMAWSLVRTGDQASANVFEVDAGLEAGGYHRFPARPLLVGLADVAARIIASGCRGSRGRFRSRRPTSPGPGP